MAVLVARDAQQPFLATVRVTSEVDFQSETRRAVPFTTDRDKMIDPMTLTPGKVQLRNSSISLVSLVIFVASFILALVFVTSFKSQSIC